MKQSFSMFIKHNNKLTFFLKKEKKRRKQYDFMDSNLI